LARSDTLGVRRTFGGERLKTAREFKGWSKEELARRTGLTGAAIGQFERGDITPNTGTLTRLSEALDVPIAFFSAGADTGGGVGAYFRSLRSTTLTERRRARAFVQYVHQFVASLEHLVELPECTLQRRPVDPEDDDEEVIEQVAHAVRRDWGLDPVEPVPNAVRLLERHGIVAVRNYAGDAKVDAFSVPFEDRSLVVLSSEKGKHDRSRFDVAHELGHLVMHRPDEQATKLVEAQAHRFAAAFLMPPEGIRGELPSRGDWPKLLRLKQKWGTSVSALLRRSRDLGRMSPEEYVNCMKALSARGWRKDEPGSVRPEEPTLLRRAVEVAQGAGWSLEDLATEAALPIQFVGQLVTGSADPRPKVRL
jgi:Zn-dependent peptidase ImmA (M78 family)/DNA-binding XRE family transcriptional regulator